MKVYKFYFFKWFRYYTNTVHVLVVLYHVKIGCQSVFKTLFQNWFVGINIMKWFEVVLTVLQVYIKIKMAIDSLWKYVIN